MESSIVPTEEAAIDFYGDTLVAVRDEAGVVWVPLRQLSDTLGLAWSGQYERIKRDPVLSEALRFVRVTRTNLGGRPEAIALPLKYVRGWLFGINAARVKPEIREKLIAYQREIIEIIDRHFSRPLSRETIDDALMAAMEENARQQAELWRTMRAEIRRLRAVETFVEELDERVGDHDKILQQHERILAELHALQADQASLLARLTDPGTLRLLSAPIEPISATQQAQITALVNDIAAAATTSGQRIGQGRSDHAAIWSTLKRRFNVAKYQDLTQAQFGQVIGWLEAWLVKVRSASPSADAQQVE